MSEGHFALSIDICQYLRVSKSLLELTPVQTVACCSPLSRAPLSQQQAEQIAPLLKALADPARLRLLSLVASHEGGEACVCDLNDAFDLSQPTISHHLKVLHDAGLLERSKRGVWVYYRAHADALAGLAALIGTSAGPTG
jgi:ArsR family transcriptional regulator, arsenate/arsenite/antimonite-responsive transcriptional repressor